MTTFALTTPKFVWYLMRGSGFVALVLFTLTTLLGVLGVARWENRRWPRLLTSSLHRNISLMALCFLALHVTTAIIDQWVGLKFIGVVVPFVSTYRPLWVGMGVLAADLVLAVLATSLLRRHLRYGAWRFVHWGAWLMWPLAVAHALGSGTDSTKGWGLVVVLACLGSVALAATFRVLSSAMSRTSPTAQTVQPLVATVHQPAGPVPHPDAAPSPSRSLGGTDRGRLVASSRSR